MLNIKRSSRSGESARIPSSPIPPCVAMTKNSGSSATRIPSATTLYSSIAPHNAICVPFDARLKSSAKNICVNIGPCTQRPAISPPSMPNKSRSAMAGVKFTRSYFKSNIPASGRTIPPSPASANTTCPREINAARTSPATPPFSADSSPHSRPIAAMLALNFSTISRTTGRCITPRDSAGSARLAASAIAEITPSSSSKTNTLSPMTTSSLSASAASAIRSPLSFVPFTLPRSRRRHAPLCVKISACLREPALSGWSITFVSGSRPIENTPLSSEKT